MIPFYILKMILLQHLVRNAILGAVSGNAQLESWEWFRRSMLSGIFTYGILVFLLPCSNLSQYHFGELISAVFMVSSKLIDNHSFKASLRSIYQSKNNEAVVRLWLLWITMINIRKVSYLLTMPPSLYMLPKVEIWQVSNNFWVSQQLSSNLWNQSLSATITEKCN